MMTQKRRIGIVAITALIAAGIVGTAIRWNRDREPRSDSAKSPIEVIRTERDTGPSARPINQTEVDVLRPGSPAENDFFGGYLASDGTTLLVSYGGDDSTVKDGGSVWVFGLRGEQWRHTDTLRRMDDVGHGRFGYSVALSGDVALVGAPYDREDYPNSTGAAYVFERGADGRFGQVAKLRTSDCHMDQLTGWSLCVSGDFALIGAPQDSLIERYAGAAYVFHRDADGRWRELQKLTAEECGEGDWFGFSVAMSAKTAAVGSRFYNGHHGAVWVFEPDAKGIWKQTARLQSDVPSDKLFGHCVALQRNRLAVGSWSSGPTYLFERREDGSWIKTAEAPSSYTIALHGDAMLLGTFPPDTVGRTGGCLLLMRNNRGEWESRAQLAQSDGKSRDSFGGSVALSDRFAIVGAEKQASVQPQSGAAYVFDLHNQTAH